MHVRGNFKKEKLKCEFCVKNCADDLKDELEFTAALHSYIEVVDATDSENVYAKGNLKGKSYMDKEIDAKNPPLMTCDKDRVTFGTKLVDSIFLNTDPEVLLHVGNGACGERGKHDGVEGPRDLESTRKHAAVL